MRRVKKSSTIKPSPAANMSISSPRKNPLSVLPVEINCDIFLRLPVKYLFRAECVSKQWHSFIKDIKLSHVGQLELLVLSRKCRKGKRLTVRTVGSDLHLQRVSHFKDPLFFAKDWTLYRKRVMCSCNGIVLVAVGSNLLLWNPLTRWCRNVLELEHLTNLNYDVLAGMCYDTSAGDYKVVFLLCHLSPDYGGRFVLLASIKNKQWRQVAFPYNLHTAIDGGVNFNNTLHWIVNDVKRARNIDEEGDYDYWHDDNESADWVWDDFCGCNKITYFDAAHDEFKTLPSPPQLCNLEEDSIVGLGIINECLCMGRRDDRMEKIEVLIMKEYGKQESWFKAFDISMSKIIDNDFYNLSFFSSEAMNAKVLIMDHCHMKALVYNSEEDIVTKECILPEREDSLGMCFYFECFVSPHGC